MPNIKTFIFISRGKIKDITQRALDKTKLQQCKQFNAWYLWYSHNSLDFPKTESPLWSILRSLYIACLQDHSLLHVIWICASGDYHTVPVYPKLPGSSAASGIFRNSGLATYFQDLGVSHYAFMSLKWLSYWWSSC